MKEKDFLGKKGELIAKNYLISKQFKILHTNWYFKHKELDIVATKNNCLHIIEVKTRSSDYWQEASDAVGLQKQKSVINAAEAYINMFDLNMDVFFDIIFIVFETSKIPTVEYIEDAFSPYE